MFIGREEQLEQLDALWRKNVASLVTCRGRRRIGKSTLVEEFARRSRVKFLKVEGLPPEEGVDNETQLKAFADQLSEQMGREIAQPTDWFAAFAILNECISPKAKTVVLIDEISWMGKFDPTFSAQLKYAWDNRFAKKSRLIVVLCGSVSSWINEKILKSKGFVGRPSLNLIVPELSIGESRAFWSMRKGGAKIASSEILDVLSITGGVPKYLESIDPTVSANENVRRLCFTRGGLLVDEFEDIFNDALDENQVVRKKILEALVNGPMDVARIAEMCSLEPNGHLSANLESLEAAGFIAKDVGLNPLNGKKAKAATYRICDNYTRFYLKYIEPEKDLIKRGAYGFLSIDQLPGWNTILGLQFESLVNNNLVPIMKLLNLERTLLTSAAPFRQNKTQRSEACQIDLLLQTRHTLYVIEIKRREQIGEEVVCEVKGKLDKFKVRKGMSVIPVLVYSGNLSRRVLADGYFARVISAEDLIGCES